MPVDTSLVGRTFPPTGPFEVTETGVRAFAQALGETYEGALPPTFPIVVHVGREVRATVQLTVEAE